MIHQNIAVTAVGHSNFFDNRLTGFRCGKSCFLRYTIGTKKTLGKMILVNHLRRLGPDNRFCGALQLTSHKQHFHSHLCQFLCMCNSIGYKCCIFLRQIIQHVSCCRTRIKENKILRFNQSGCIGCYPAFFFLIDFYFLGNCRFTACHNTLHCNGTTKNLDQTAGSAKGSDIPSYSGFRSIQQILQLCNSHTSSFIQHS